MRTLLITLLFAWGTTASANVVILDRIAAIVDDAVIMESEVRERMRTVKAQLAGSGSAAPADDVIRRQIVERLIVESIQMQMATRAGVRVSDEELNEAMRRIAAQNRLSLDQFRGALARDGMPYADMREQVRREIMIGRVQQGIMRNRIEISDQEIQTFLDSDVGEAITSDEFRLAHILLAIPSEASGQEINAVKLQAEDVLRQIRAGADFQTLAVEKSAGQNALEGGDLGWRKPAQIPTMFSDIAQNMDIGDVYGPIKSGSGFHLIKLLQKRGAKAEGKVDQTRVRHILIQPSEIRTLQEAKELAESLRLEVAEGRDFEEVAKLFSDDPGSALSGGDLGWSRSADFVSEFAQQMNDADINELTGVFRTEFGYHFLEVIGRRVEDFSERFKRNQAENYLRSQMFDEELDTWLREIREDAYIEIRI